MYFRDGHLLLLCSKPTKLIVLDARTLRTLWTMDLLDSELRINFVALFLGADLMVTAGGLVYSWRRRRRFLRTCRYNLPLQVHAKTTLDLHWSPVHPCTQAYTYPKTR